MDIERALAEARELDSRATILVVAVFFALGFLLALVIWA